MSCYYQTVFIIPVRRRSRSADFYYRGAPEHVCHRPPGLYDSGYGALNAPGMFTLRAPAKKSISRSRILQLLSECAISDSKVYRNGHLVDYGQDGDTASRRPALVLLRRRRRRIYFSDGPPLDFDGHRNGRALYVDDKSRSPRIIREVISPFSLSLGLRPDIGGSAALMKTLTEADEGFCSNLHRGDACASLDALLKKNIYTPHLMIIYEY